MGEVDSSTLLSLLPTEKSRVSPWPVFPFSSQVDLPHNVCGTRSLCRRYEGTPDPISYFYPKPGHFRLRRTYELKLNHEMGRTPPTLVYVKTHLQMFLKLKLVGRTNRILI